MTILLADVLTTMPGPTRKTTRDDVIVAMQARDNKREPWTTKEIAVAVDCSHSTAYNRLRELKTQNRVKTKSVGSSGRVWWLTETVDTHSRTPDRRSMHEVES
jgi:hypothetical protein